MKKHLSILILAVFTAGAAAETRVVDSVQSSVNISQGQTIENSNGVTVQTGGITHISGSDANGEKNSQWCTGTFTSKGEEFLGGAGMCTVVSDNGDYLWVWFRPTGPGTNDWGVINGTGQWAGATGGGTTGTTTQLVDGTSVGWSKGEIEMK